MVATAPGAKFLTSRPRIGDASAPVSPILKRGSGRFDLEMMMKRRPEAGARLVATSNLSRALCGKACAVRPISTIREVVASLAAYFRSILLCGCLRYLRSDADRRATIVF